MSQTTDVYPAPVPAAAPSAAPARSAEAAGPPELPVRSLPWEGASATDREPLLAREWLVTNGLGGYASSTVAGVTTRRYHGFLVAALPPPFGRTMMLNQLTELLRLPDGKTMLFAGAELVGPRLELHGVDELEEFRLEGGLPVWRYRVGDTVFERRVYLPYGRNTVHVSYRLLECAGTVRLKLRPALHFRNHDAHVSVPLADPYVLTAEDDRYEVRDASDLPPLRLALHGERQAFTAERQRLRERLYRTEEGRGYESVGELWALGYFRADLAVGSDVTLVASTEPWESFLGDRPADVLAAELDRRRSLLGAAAPEAREGVAAELVLAADQFVVAPIHRQEAPFGAEVSSEELRSVIAGYHWFTDWGRDTMISLEGLTLVTGRHDEARHVLRTFASAMRDGLVPNLFPEGESEGLYHTADATLWFFHALSRYLDVTGDRATLRELLPQLLASARQHLDGTRFGIGVDPADGLVRQGQQGYQLTWMDAKVGDWVVTPRRGKAVEINALWYNALRLLERWAEEEGVTTGLPLGDAAERCRDSFNRRFWCEETGHLYDVVDCDGQPGKDDPALRPNQLLAFSLAHPVLDRDRWERVLEIVARELLTPVGLRSLGRSHPNYQPRYFGDLRARDAAYHQGTVWGWLIGPFVDAWLRVHPDDRGGAREVLHGLCAHLDEACVGSMSEVFDAEAPFTPRGCIAQAWSVAEVLRCWVLTKREPTR
jgi:predicted glycogen debranching enzyme